MRSEHELRRMVVQRYALRNTDGAVVICLGLRGKYKPAYPDRSTARHAAKELTPLVDHPLTEFSCGGHYHLTTDWSDGRARPFSNLDRVVLALLNFDRAVSIRELYRVVVVPKEKHRRDRVQKALWTLEMYGLVHTTCEEEVRVVDRAGLMMLYGSRHPDADIAERDLRGETWPEYGR